MYNFIILSYYFFIKIGSLFNKKAKDWIEGRKNLFDSLNKIDKSKKTIWFHCSSLGEYEQGIPIIQKTKEKFPDIQILLTFFSPSGYNHHKKIKEVDYVFYMPLDTNKNISKFLDIVNPVYVVFIKYEFWYNTINQLYKRDIPIIYACSCFRKSQYFFKWYGKWFRNILRNVNHFFVQNKESKLLLENVGITNVTISGDTRFDRVYAIAKKDFEDKKIENFIGDNKNVLIAGSTWTKDEVILKKLAQKHKNYLFIIAPHEVDKENILRVKKLFNGNALLYSEITEESVISNKQVLIIDCIGLLSRIYRYARITYVGGGFGKGIHNVLEPAAYSLPVIFGPNFEKFTEAITLVSEKGGFVIKNCKDFSKIISLMDDKEYYNKTIEICNNYINSNIGASKKIVDLINF